MRKSKQEIVLKALLNGLVVFKLDQPYTLDTDFNLCQVCVKYEHSRATYGTVLVKVNFGDFTFSQFVRWAESFTDDEIKSVAFQLGLLNV